MYINNIPTYSLYKCLCVYMYVLCICLDLKFYIMDVTRMFFNGKFKYVFNNSILKKYQMFLVFLQGVFALVICEYFTRNICDYDDDCGI